MSFFFLGLGQIFNRQPMRGLVFSAILTASILLTGELRLPWTFLGLLISLVFQLALLVWAVSDAAICGGQKAKERSGFSVARIWYSCAILLVILNTVGQGTNFYRNYFLGGLEARVDRSDSMAPTIDNGDRLISDTRCYAHNTPRRGDVILFRAPGQASIDVVKRVVGIGGDVIEGRQDGVYLNGDRLDEPYVLAPSAQDSESTGEINIYGPVKVPAGEFFMLGDNRQNSYDSRYYGAIPASSIRGRALYIYFSHHRNRIGKTIR